MFLISETVREKVTRHIDEVKKLYYRNLDPVKEKPPKILILKVVEADRRVFFALKMRLFFMNFFLHLNGVNIDYAFQ